MAALGEIPFGRYYGSVDATPLFIVLAGAYYERSGDRRFLATLWPHIQLALQWIDQYGDPTGMGFTTYARRTDKGLVHQGWKDSHDAIFHADGAAVEGPIALCEVQAYVYQAKQTAADLARLFKDLDHADRLLKEADSLRNRFERAFWCEDWTRMPLLWTDRGGLAVYGHQTPVIASMAVLRGRNAEYHDTRTIERGVFQRMGHPHDRDLGGTVQPDVLP